MIEVALETSTRGASVAARTPRGLLEVALEADTAHASTLLPRLAELLERLDATPREVGAVYVGLGPGSYTGLRVGVATALGLARGAAAVLRGEASAEVLLARELAPGEEGVFLIDARQEELYFARYRREGGELVTLRAPCVLRAEDVRAELARDGARVFADATAADAAGLDAATRARLVLDARPSAAALLELAGARLAREGAHAADAVQPLYLRDFRAKQRRR
ncbi:MAG: tRNA (adenosine(37)-N6)-threonylcarbamoyltransferase complex dimerization subunit type 1 TsaB [Planctomycetes bacterium]|nr:tRNA (adenosine(37)-N6)-threonylcarbamoyltransferase complex dimerization subunit type 1 TsaB [Planctomycetota bacterium]